MSADVYSSFPAVPGTSYVLNISYAQVRPCLRHQSCTVDRSQIIHLSFIPANWWIIQMFC